MADNDQAIKLASTALKVLGESPEIHKALEDAFGDEVFLESRKKDGTIVKSINWDAILKIIPQLLPIILGLFTGGGLSVPAIMALIQALLAIFSPATSKALQAAHAPQAGDIVTV